MTEAPPPRSLGRPRAGAGPPHRSAGAWRVYADKRVLLFVFLGFSSGLPLALVGTTLSAWLAESGISKTAIGLFGLVGLPYSLKFLWAPLLDRVRLPFLTQRLGRRRGWALLSQLGLALSLVALSGADPVADTTTVAVLALVLAFFSASQDIVIDAYRVELLPPDAYAAGAAVHVLGYRFGMLTSGAGALYLASTLPWGEVYGIMAGFVAVGIGAVLLAPEPAPPRTEHHIRAASGSRLGRLAAWSRAAILAPFADFMRRPLWPALLVFIALFKLGDVFVGVMAMPFYLELGFSKIHIANVTKVFGLLAMIAGGFFGGAVVHRFGVLRGLMLCGLVQMLSNLVFAGLAAIGPDVAALTLAIAVENVSGGMATAAFIAFLSTLCTPAYAATQYALLSSLFAFARDVLGAGGGWLADQMDWVAYFLLATLAALPALLLLGWMLQSIRRLEPDRSETAHEGAPGPEPAGPTRPGAVPYQGHRTEAEEGKDEARTRLRHSVAMAPHASPGVGSGRSVTPRAGIRQP